MKRVALVLMLVSISSRGEELRGANVRRQDWRQLRLGALSMIRIRWQMDAIRLVGEMSDAGLLKQILRDAETVGLKVLYSPGETGPLPLSPAARLEAHSAAEALALRKRGIKGAIYVPAEAREQLPQGDWVWTVESHFDRDKVDDDRDQHFGKLTEGKPLTVRSWGLDLSEDTPACRIIPNDPEDAGEMVMNALDYFAEHKLSWFADFFAPGWLIQDFASYEPTVIFGPWLCGKPDVRRGMGEVVQYALWDIKEGELVAVGPSGAPVSAPGAVTILYGTQIEKGMKVWSLDSGGTRREARIISNVPGQINFVIPEETKTGKLSLVLDPGGHKAHIEIRKVVPAVWTRSSNAQGEAVSSRRDGRLILHGSGMHGAGGAELIWQGRVFPALKVQREPGTEWNDEIHFAGDLEVKGEAVLRIGNAVSNAFVLP